MNAPDQARAMGLRTVRVPADVWAAASAQAERDSTTVSAVIRAALAKYGYGTLRPCLCDAPHAPEGCAGLIV